MIAIKEFTEQDKINFEEFLKTERRSSLLPPPMNLSPLVPPHEDIIVAAIKHNKDISSVAKFADQYKFIVTNYNKKIISLSRHIPKYSANNTMYIFSGYVFYNKKMLIGVDEVAENIDDVMNLNELDGEYCICSVGNGNITLSSDFFGMVSWFYFDNDEVFAASNNYHALLEFLSSIHVDLNMDIDRSCVNIITTGYTYGSPFSDKLDVIGCRVSHSYERICYTTTGGLHLQKTFLWDILNKTYIWDEDLYESCILKARDEICENVKAALEHPKFKKVVIDVSGGFDSRIVFAAVTTMPKKLRNKVYTYTRRSKTVDDEEKASAITNLYSYPRYSYEDTDNSLLFDVDGKLNLAHVSRTLGCFSVNTDLYISKYDNTDTLEFTGGLGDAVFGYARIRGELDYSLGDSRLLARLGGCYWHNSCTELKSVFKVQETIINETLSNYNSDCLFKKFHWLYIDYRNRFNFNSSHNIEHDNMRIPMCFSRHALMAKWLYFSLFRDNKVPDEKVSVDVLAAINPLLACLPFAKNNDKVLPKQDNLLNPVKISVQPDYTQNIVKKGGGNAGDYRARVNEYMGDLKRVEQMILHIYDYSPKYYSVCLALYKMVELLREQPEEAGTSHTYETIRKLYDAYFQIEITKKAKVIQE